MPSNMEKITIRVLNSGQLLVYITSENELELILEYVDILATSDVILANAGKLDRE